MTLITAEYLRSIIHYDPETGQFRWLPRPGIMGQYNARYAGCLACRKTIDGYISIRIRGRGYFAHRLAWLYVHGDWPTELDHIDRDRSNNAFSNLREVTKSINSMNRMVLSASGFRGVTWHKQVGKWQASIGSGKTQQYLGLFADKLDAARAYRDAALAKHGEIALTFPGVLP